jgi:putative hydrolase of HD superfamily
MENKIDSILKFLKEIELLKTVTRHSWTSSGRQESVAEHSWRMAILSFILEEEFPDLDMKRIIEMILIHDIGEAYDGDYPAFRDQPKNKLEMEKKAVKKIISNLPNNLQNKIMGLWTEYNECKTQEARLAKALDKIEVLIQHNEADIKTWEPEEYEANITHGKEYMNFNDFIKKFRERVDKQTIEKIKNNTKP